MALLTTGQRLALQDHARIRQVWKIHVPRAAGSTTFDAVTIHDDDSSTNRVTDAGMRECFAYNVSLRDPGKLEVGASESKATGLPAPPCGAVPVPGFFVLPAMADQAAPRALPWSCRPRAVPAIPPHRRQQVPT